MCDAGRESEEQKILLAATAAAVHKRSVLRLTWFGTEGRKEACRSEGGQVSRKREWERHTRKHTQTHTQTLSLSLSRSYPFFLLDACKYQTEQENS